MWRCLLLASCGFMFLLGPADGCCGKPRGSGGGGKARNKTGMIKTIVSSNISSIDPPRSAIQELNGMSNNFNSSVANKGNWTLYLVLEPTEIKTEAIRSIDVFEKRGCDSLHPKFFAKTGVLRTDNPVHLWCLNSTTDGGVGQPIDDIVLVRLTAKEDQGKNPIENKYKSELSKFAKCIELLKAEYTKADEMWICWSLAPA